MSDLSVSQLLQYVRVQMAAESLYGYDARKPLILTPGETRSGSILPAWLTEGNGHASKFTETDATKFVSEWEVIEHKSNTDSGFSGTLFKNKTTGEYVLSIRSTEFIDDAARDCEATNDLEIKAKGWAFGQIDDLEQWYQDSLKSKIGGATLNVTGYSLGGHLATAFNLMHNADLNGGEVVTFNGAGVGQINGADVTAQPSALVCTPLQTMMAEFHDYRTNKNGMTQDLMTTAKGKTLYNGIKSAIN